MWPFGRRSETKLYAVAATYRDQYDFPICRISNIANVDVQWVTGRPIKYPLPDVIRYEMDKELPLEDYVLNGAGSILVSPRLWALIKEVSSCARPYRTQIYFRERLVASDYVAVNLECSFSCLDARRSRFRNVGVGRLLERGVVVAARIPADQIFRLGESTGNLVATAGFVRSVTESGLTGFSFQEMTVVDT